MGIRLHRWAEASALHTLLTTELNGLAIGNYSAGGTAFDNRLPRLVLADFEVQMAYAVNATGSPSLVLYLIPALDGDNYADGAAGGATAPAAQLQVGNFSPRTGTTNAQRLLLRRIVLPPWSFKAVLSNGSTQAFAASGNQLRMRGYGEEIAL